MTDQNGDGLHNTAAVLPPVGKPFSAGYDARRNAGGRPKGLAAARAAVGEDGYELIAFFRAVMNGDREFLGESKVTLDHRLEAAKWLGDRAFGRATLVIEQQDAPAGPLTPEQGATLREMPDTLKQQIREWLEARRAEYLAAQRAEAQAKMAAYLPQVGPDGNGHVTR